MDKRQPSAQAFVAATSFLALFSIVGLALYGSAAFMYIFALRKIPVSVAFPSVSLSYAVVAVMGHFLFEEPFGIKQIGGIVLIMGGVMLINQH